MVYRAQDNLLGPSCLGLDERGHGHAINAGGDDLVPGDGLEHSIGAPEAGRDVGVGGELIVGEVVVVDARALVGEGGRVSESHV